MTSNVRAARGGFFGSIGILPVVLAGVLPIIGCGGSSGQSKPDASIGGRGGTGAIGGAAGGAGGAGGKGGASGSGGAAGAGGATGGASGSGGATGGASGSAGSGGAAGVGGASGGAGGRGGAAGSGGTAGGGGATGGGSGSGGSAGSGGMAGSAGAAGAPFPAPHGPAPQVVSLGGKVIASPIFVPVFFSGDDATMVAKIEDFDAKVGASSYWKTVTDEYGVGAAAATAPVMLTETAPLTIDDTAIQTWLAAKINSANPAFPAPTAKTIYVLHYPAATTVTIGASRGCQDFGSYHSETMATSTKLAYAVVPRCADYNGFSGVDAATALESQALVDAATDPHPLTDLAYASLDDAHLYWTVLGSEAAGLCANMPGTIATTTGLPYAVQRSWSNAAAAASHDPCVPQNAGQVYFNAVPVLSDDIPYPGSTTVKMKGVKIPPNGTKTINVQLFSDAATTGAWTVAAYDGSTLSGGPARLTLALDRATGVNGDQLQLTITVTSAASNNIETFFLTSTLGSEQHLWVGLVGN